MKHYKAPWSTSLVVVTSAVTVLLLGVTFAMVFYGRGIISSAGLLPLAIIVCSVPFTIRGYTVTPDAILGHRLFWTTRLPLSGLQQFRTERREDVQYRAALAAGDNEARTAQHRRVLAGRRERDAGPAGQLGGRAAVRDALQHSRPVPADQRGQRRSPGGGPQAPAARIRRGQDQPAVVLAPRVLAPSAMGSVSRNTSDLTMPCVAAL